MVVGDGDRVFFFTSRNERFIIDKLKSKLEKIVCMEKRMLDTCQQKYGL